MYSVLSWAFSPQATLAHGFGDRIDLPVPFRIYMLGAIATVALSFILIGILAGKKASDAYPRYDLTSLRWFRSIAHPLLSFAKVLSLFLAVLVVIGGPIGSPIPSFNITPVVVWVMFGIGLVYVSAFLGNIWPSIHPCGVVIDFCRSLKKNPKVYATTWSPIAYWPAFAGYFLYRWVENVYPYAARPENLSLIVFWYLFITFIGMLWIGKDRWLKYCDPFAVFFTFLSFFSITELDKGKLYLRPPGVGLMQITKMSTSQIIFEMIMLSGISFDGMKETSVWQTIHENILSFGFSSMQSLTIGMTVFLLGFVLTYFFFCWMISRISNKHHLTYAIASGFAFSLLPIAVAYELVHYLSLFLIEAQRMVYLISDPFGLRWDLFGTALYEVRYDWLNYTLLWNIQVALIVIGHIIAVYIAHMRALNIFPNRALAIRSQYPMLVLMICYTVFSLWIIGQPIINR